MKNLEFLFDKQLKRGNLGDAPTFLEAACRHRKLIVQAPSYKEGMSAVAAYGGLIKRWHHFLIEHITDVALKGVVTSRTNVSNWQKAVFGKSVASVELKKWADSSRGPSDKIASIDIYDPISCEASELFAQYKDKLKDKSSVF